MAGTFLTCSAQPTRRPPRSLHRSSSHRRSASVACPRTLWRLIAGAEATRLLHEQVQRLCRAVSNQLALRASSTTTSDAGLLETPPPLAPPATGAFCPTTAVAASLAT
ncbi:hypothetical protein MTO96_041434 [Rhipicephalus appendiculatus]